MWIINKKKSKKGEKAKRKKDAKDHTTEEANTMKNSIYSKKHQKNVVTKDVNPK